MPAEPRTAKGRATRDRIIGATREALIAGGGRADLQDIAVRAHVPPSLIHRYFDSRSGLISTVVADFYDRLSAEVVTPDLTEIGPWPDRERERVRRGISFHYNTPFASVVYGPLGREPRVAAAETELIGRIIALGADNIRRGQHDGDLPSCVDPELASAAIFGSLRSLLVTALARPTRPEVDALAATHWRQVAAAVGLPPGR
ncbi:TetR/AcrR family transcriptional regulator [Streptomyces sp. AJS327]|uniref:TetR/AcrR family transcriptional regulator n=1 Tax=Streptomyces sp. AJS327 TaxID=2545265 RepID=UPI0015DEDFCA|nr:TetR/AcrR family transcriptional regulator [Streptomyces sp. AJS327]